MSALETTVIQPGQTLILAGDKAPRRDFANLGSRRPLTIVATRADETLLLMQDGSDPTGSSLVPTPRHFSTPSNPARAYLSTQALSPRGTAHLVDVYA